MAAAAPRTDTSAARGPDKALIPRGRALGPVAAAPAERHSNSRKPAMVQPTPQSPAMVQSTPQRSGMVQRTPQHPAMRSEEHTSELRSLIRHSYAAFFLTKTATNRSLIR